MLWTWLGRVVGTSIAAVVSIVPSSWGGNRAHALVGCGFEAGAWREMGSAGCAVLRALVRPHLHTVSGEDSLDSVASVVHAHAPSIVVLLQNRH